MGNTTEYRFVGGTSEGTVEECVRELGCQRSGMRGPRTHFPLRATQGLRGFRALLTGSGGTGSTSSRRDQWRSPREHPRAARVPSASGRGPIHRGRGVPAGAPGRRAGRRAQVTFRSGLIRRRASKGRVVLSVHPGSHQTQGIITLCTLIGSGTRTRIDAITPMPIRVASSSL